MKIYAIWKLSTKDGEIVEAAYSDSFFQMGMNDAKEKQLVDSRIKTTIQGKYATEAIAQQGYQDYPVLSYYNFRPVAFIKGACVIIGDKEFEQLEDSEQSFLIRNILPANRDLSKVIDDPEHYTSQYDYIHTREPGMPSVTDTGPARFFQDPTQLDNRANALTNLFACFNLKCL